MRYIKNHWFLKSPRVDPDFTALLIPTPDQTKTPVPLDRWSDYGYRIYNGVYPPGGAAVEQATGKLRLLTKPPANGDELPHSVWDRRAKERFDFQGLSGMTACFCIRQDIV
jgi:hypothetical protein